MPAGNRYRQSLAAAVPGGQTGIATSVVAIGEGVNAENIAGHDASLNVRLEYRESLS